MKVKDTVNLTGVVCTAMMRSSQSDARQTSTSSSNMCLSNAGARDQSVLLHAPAAIISRPSAVVDMTINKLSPFTSSLALYCY